MNMDPATLSALILSIISALVIFIKGIRKCRIGNFLEIERESTLSAVQQREIMSSMMTIFNTNFTPRRTETIVKANNAALAVTSGTKDIESQKPQQTQPQASSSTSPTISERKGGHKRRPSKYDDLCKDITPSHTLEDVARRFGMEPKLNSFSQKDTRIETISPENNLQTENNQTASTLVPVIETTPQQTIVSVLPLPTEEEAKKHHRKPSLSISDLSGSDDTKNQKVTQFLVKRKPQTSQ